MQYIGIDGCRAGWFISAVDDKGNWSFEIAANLEEYFKRDDVRKNLKQVLIDIPIGLMENQNARACEKEARKILGNRASSVFNVPVSGILDIKDYQKANEKNRKHTGHGLSKQTFYILKKIREVNLMMRKHVDLPVRESHPEVVFYFLNGKRNLKFNKKKKEGKEERLDILSKYIKEKDMRTFIEKARGGALKKKVADDDIVDSIALALISKKGNLKSLPALPERDAYGVKMEIVYWGKED